MNKHATNEPVGSSVQPGSSATPLVYRINVAEAKLGVSRSTIYRLIDAGTLRRVKLGRRACGVTAESVHAMIGGRSEEPASASRPGSQPGSQVARVAILPAVSR